jgi:hypothetical protein
MEIGAEEFQSTTPPPLYSEDRVPVESDFFRLFFRFFAFFFIRNNFDFTFIRVSGRVERMTAI